MNMDKYNEVINGKDTYKTIADMLKVGKSTIIGWSNEKYTHLDILFSYVVYKEYGNMLQRGLNGRELFVSIISIGSFGFDIDNSQKSSGYISEKLNIHGRPTIDKLAELINRVIKELQKEELEYESN